MLRGEKVKVLLRKVALTRFMTVVVHGKLMASPELLPRPGNPATWIGRGALDFKFWRIPWEQELL
jgi:hypothetical protein